VAEKLNLTAERVKLYLLQKERVSLDHEIEKKLRKTFPALSQDVRLLSELLDKLEADNKQHRTTKLPDHLSV
jgi:pantothenate kinase-related protein Tda10